MTVQLADLGDSLKRAIAVPGLFDDSAFSEMGEDDLLGALMDGFAEAQLDGFFPGLTFDVDTGEVSADLGHAEGALVVIYSSTRILQSQLRDVKTHVKYVAGSVSFEQDSPAGVLTSLLKSMDDRKKELRTTARTAGAGSAFYMADRYLAMTGTGYGGF